MTDNANIPVDVSRDATGPACRAGNRWTVSIVSHGHGERVVRVLTDIHAQLQAVPHRLVLTLNAGEDAGFVERLPASVRSNLSLIRNAVPQGFAANHNAALQHHDSDFVLVADPDLSLPQDIFEALESRLENPRCGIVAPLAQMPDGRPQDNGRALITPMTLARRYLAGRRRDRPPATTCGTTEVDWLAGLFLAMRSDTFRRLRGFDDGYYLYCEDVDICLRARQLGLSVDLLCDLRITHVPGRATLKKLDHFAWHVQSLLRLWRSPVYRDAIRLGRT